MKNFKRQKHYYTFNIAYNLYDYNTSNKYMKLYYTFKPQLDY